MTWVVTHRNGPNTFLRIGGKGIFLMFIDPYVYIYTVKMTWPVIVIEIVYTKICEIQKYL